MAEHQKIVVEVDFNYPGDGEEFGEGDRIVSFNRFIEQGQGVIGFSFPLGRKKENDDTISLIFPYAELLSKIAELEIEE